MSGIAGIVGTIDELEYCLSDMMRCQQHRGDGACGFWVSAFAGENMGLSCCSRMVGEMDEPVRQPLVDEDTQLVIMVDGDISNYVELRNQLKAKYTFKTESSVEVLSKAYRNWGEGFLSRLKGAFAIVIYDKLQDVLLIARDGFGVKPLYYTTYRGALFFASEIRPLFESGLRAAVSVERWASYMLYTTYGAEYMTFWENVYMLPAGSLLRYNGSSLLEEQWYNLHDDMLDWMEGVDEESISKAWTDTLEFCAEQSFSDVSCCGLRVSARVESQLLHAIVSRGQYGCKIHAFTGEIENIGQQPVATPVWITESDVVRELEQMPQWVEEPFDGRESLFRIVLFRRMRYDGVRLLCSGRGLDVLWRELWDETGLRYNYKLPHSIFSSHIIASAQRPYHQQQFSGVNENNCYCDLYCERMPHILRVINRTAAEAGLSLRLPFLDRDLVALSFLLPLSLHCNRRRLYEEYVGGYGCRVWDGIADIAAPMKIRGAMSEWINDTISGLRSDMHEWFDVVSLEKLRQRLNAGEVYDEALLWKCVSLYMALKSCRC